MKEKTAMTPENNGQTSFSKLLFNQYSQLTKSEKKIADYLLRSQDEAAFLAAGEIASHLKLSEPTIVRFARKLGFEGYPALREALQENFRQRMTHSTRLRSRLDNLREGGDLFERLVTSEIDYLTEAMHTLSRASLDAAVDLLRTHQRIFVYGLGPSTSLVDLLDIRLTRTARQVIPLKTSGREIIEPMMLMTGSDLLIAIGFYNPNPSLRMVLDFAGERGTPVILLTDTLGDLLGNQAAVVLAARRGPVASFHSLTVPMCILNTLLLALSSAEQEKVVSHLDAMDQLREKLTHIKRSG
jgi:DNA-binding MurR/RpiR family transcriptional regulator